MKVDGGKRNERAVALTPRRAAITVMSARTRTGLKVGAS